MMIENIVLNQITSMNFDSLKWQQFREGVSIFPIYQSDNSTANAALLRYVAGAEVPEHEHTGYEHILVLEGSQADAKGEYFKGDFVVNFPFYRHWVKSDHGCIVLAIWEKPVRFI